MTAGVAHHLISRAVEITQQHYNGNNGEAEGQTYELGGKAFMLILATVVIYLGMISMISYTYGDVVATLTMIETPTATAFKTEYTDSDETDAPLLSQDQKSEKAKIVESDLFLVKQKPITSKIRTTIKHICAQAGPLARFRGIHVAIIYQLLHGAIVGFFSANVITHPVARPFIAVLASIALCRLQMTWSHIVISNPSTKSWFRRIPSRAAVRNILVPTAVLAIAEQASIFVPKGLFILCNQAYNEESNENVGRAQNIAFVQMISVCLIGLGIFVLFVVPADVTLKRIQASMLPEEDETIVPFDRTFAGKVKPVILGGSGAVSMFEAWKSFDRSARIRLMKLYFKIVLVSVFTTIMFVMVVIGELRFFMGDKLNDMVGKAHESLQQAKAGSPMF